MRKFFTLAACFFVAASAHAADVRVNEDGLVAYTITDGVSINDSLTGVAGDAENGRKLAINRKKGNCLACHVMPIKEQPYHGETAPSLYGVGNRLSEGELRMQVVNSKVTNPDTMMPSFYRTVGYNRPGKKFVGKTIISAQDVEDVVAYLLTLTKDE